MPGKRGLTNPQPIRTFDEVFSEHHLSKEERTALVWRLAAIRMRRLVETLAPEPEIDIRDLGAR